MTEVFVSLDLETTGLDSLTDEIIEVGAVKFNTDGVLDTYHSMAKPSKPLPYRTQIITGITEHDLEKAPKLASVMTELAVFLGSDTIIGQNIGFDLAFLAQQDIKPRGRVYDVFALATIVLPTLPDYRLSALATALGLSSVQYHRAMHDAVAAKDVFLALLDRLRSFDTSIIAELERLSATADWPLAPLFRAASGEKLGDVFSVAPEPAFRIYSLAKEKEERLHPKPQRELIDVKRLAAMLGEDGIVARSLSRFEYRKEQDAMTRAVAQALNRDERLIVEAGTGTGKSIAYLLPSIIFASSNEVPVVVSTSTISLQEQLVGKDIPDLAEALQDVPFRCVQMKGRSNYLCMRRWNLYRHGRVFTKEEAGFIARMLVWLKDSEGGDKAELSLRKDEQALWNRVCAQSESCLGMSCPYQRRGQCFLYRARRRAEGAHLIVVNHALLLSDVAAKSGVLPDYRHLIIDEAHNLEEEATEQWGFEAGERDLRGYLDRLGQREAGGSRYGGLLFELAEHFRGSAVPIQRQHEIGEMVGEVYRSVERGREHMLDFFDALSRFMQGHAEDRGSYEQRLRVNAAKRQTQEWQDVELAGENITLALEEIETGLARIYAAVEPLDSMLDHDNLMLEIASSMHRCEELCRNIGWASDAEEDMIYWLSSLEGSVTMHAAPLDVSSVLEKDLFSTKDCLVLTGATLSTEDNFEYLKGRLGLSDVTEVLLGSPFNYKEAALIYLPDDVPDPGVRGYQKAVSQALIDVCRAAGGRTMALFTSHAALRASYEDIREQLRGDDILVLGQGLDGSPRQLIRAIKDDPRTVLLGTASFWEGVDVAGDSLSVLVITRLPFNVPTDPIFVARSELFDNAFNEYAVPKAILKFKQGFGRLIRTRSDRGVVVILDSRVRSKSYGAAFLSSLPNCTVKTGPARRVAEEAVAWLGRG